MTVLCKTPGIDAPSFTTYLSSRRAIVDNYLELAIAVVGIPATFFATKAGLESRVEVVEERLEVRLKFQDEMDRGVFNVQRNLLTMLAGMVQQARAEVNDSRPIEIAWEVMQVGPNTPPMPPGWPPAEVIKTVTPPVSAVDARMANLALAEPRFLALQDSSLVRSVGELSHALNEYSIAVARASGLMPTTGFFSPDLRPGMFRYTVEPELNGIRSARNELRRVLNGFNFDAAIAAELARVDTILSR